MPETSSIPRPWEEDADEQDYNKDYAKKQDYTKDYTEKKSKKLRIVAAALPDPPHWTFFSSVFQFPWSSGTLIRWVGITVGLSAVSQLAVTAWEIGGTVGIGLVGLGVMALGLLVASYALSICLSVILDTSEGYDTVEHWPESDWRIWFLSALATSWLLLTAVAFGALVRWTVGFGMWWTQPLTVFVAFPILVLSSIEAGSALIPMSGIIARSLWKIWWGWAMFYLQSSLLISALGGIFLLTSLWNLPMACLLSAPVAATVLLISARLLGRVAWLVSTRMHVPQSEPTASSEDTGRIVIS